MLVFADIFCSILLTNLTLWFCSNLGALADMLDARN